MHRRDVFPGHLLGALWRLRRTGTHAVGTDGLERLAAKALDVSSFDQLEVPLSVASLDLTEGRLRVLDSGMLVPALLASAAIPGVFAPVRLDGHLLVDGGVVANVPVAVAAGLGARSLVVLDCTGAALVAPGTLMVGAEGRPAELSGTAAPVAHGVAVRLHASAHRSDLARDPEVLLAGRVSLHCEGVLRPRAMRATGHRLTDAR